MGAPPPALAEAAILAPTSELVHRVEIFEQDGVTRWDNGDSDDRLIDGSVSVDYSRDERRSLDVTLDNSDFGLQHAPGEFWYDKVLKVYSGVRFMDTSVSLSTRVKTNLATNPRGVTTSGFSTGSSDWTVAYNQAITGHPLGILTAVKCTVANAVTAGTTTVYLYNIDALGSSATPRYAGCWFYSSVSGYIQLNYASDVNGSKTVINVSAGSWTFITTNGIGSGNLYLYFIKNSASVNGDYGYVTGVVTQTVPVESFFDGAVQNFANRAYAWAGTVNASSSTETVTIADYTPRPSIWETQIGEFMIDNINEDHFPYIVKVNGRDYTKKCQLSKFVVSTTFTYGTSIENAIKAMAQNSGITKFILPLTGKQLGKDYVFDRGVARWDGMKEIADAFGYEIFFDPQGYLVMREYYDPNTSPLTYTIRTGPNGTLVSYSKAVNDTRIYNHIVVTGESSDSDLLPVSAEAINNNPLSPTSVDEIGDRLYQYSSPFITTVLQAQDIADKFLLIHALEEFDLSFSSIALVWLEAGEIIEFADPRPNPGQPTRFLLSGLTLPLGLGAMSGNAKRVSVVG